MRTLTTIADELGEGVGQAEESIDLAIAAVADLVGKVARARVAARGFAGINVADGQHELLRLADIQIRLTKSGSDVLRVHQGMADVYRRASPDVYPICDDAAKAVVGLVASDPEHRRSVH